MRNLLFVAASTSHATWLCLAFGCTSCDPLGRTLLSARTYLGDPGNCQFSFGDGRLLRYRPDIGIGAAGRTIALTTSTRRHERTHQGNAGCCYEIVSSTNSNGL